MESFCNCANEFCLYVCKFSYQFPKICLSQIDGVMVPDGACWYKAQMIAYIVALVCNCAAWVCNHFRSVFGDLFAFDSHNLYPDRQVIVRCGVYYVGLSYILPWFGMSLNCFIGSCTIYNALQLCLKFSLSHL